MNRYTKKYFLFLIVVLGWGVGTFLYMALQSSHYDSVVAITTQPDAAMSTEAHFIRHRSLTDLFEVFGLGAGLLPYFPSDFIYAPPPYLNAKEELR